jgi:hypothetical protein
VRNIRVRADENIPPTLPGQKTIHQRNKSSPALSTMLGSAGLKAPAKRTAFGDVSNTINGVRPTKDDGSIAFKQGVQCNDKPIPAVADKKPTTFLKQASRPYSVSNLRGLLTGISGNTNTEVPLKPAAVESQTLANSRKTVTKRPATTIFKDVTLPALQEAAVKSQGETQTAATSIPLPKLSSLPEVPTLDEGPDTAQLQPVPASDASIDDIEKSSVQPSITSSEVEESAALRSDGIYIDEKGNVQIYQEVQPEADHKSQTTSIAPKPTYTGLTGPGAYPVSVADALPASYASVASSMPYIPPPPRAEPEEYWEEEEEENYEEEGYVTARSFRSRGENTTGGATTVLFPQVNQKIKREIEVAKQLVEAERTPEEIEDECFDTSMVAEYGEEIFDYMRDLEVSRCKPNVQERVTDFRHRSRCCRIPTTWTTRQRSSGQCAPC